MPARPSDLESATTGWKVHSVANVTSAGVADELRRATDRIRDDPCALAEQDIFDLAYSCNSSLALMAADAQDALSEMTSVAVQQATRACHRALSDSEPDRELAKRRSLLKAAAFLQSWLVSEAEKMQTRASQVPAAGGKTSKRKPTAVSEDWAWENHREASALRMLGVRSALDFAFYLRLSLPHKSICVALPAGT